MAESPADPPPDDARILWDVVAEHLDEAEFLFEQWHAALDSPLYTLTELDEGPEERLRAHIDGLVVGGRVVTERLLWPVMGGDPDEPMRIGAATLAIAALPDPRWIDAVIAEVGAGEDPDRRAALALGLAATERPDVSAKIAAALERTPDAPGRAQWLELLGRRGGLPGQTVHRALADSDPAVRASALRAARFLGPAVGLAAAETLLADPDPAVVAVAAEVGLVLGSAAAWSLVQQQATATVVAPAVAGRAMVLSALVGDAAHAERIAARLDDETMRPHALWALGFCGRVEAIAPLLSWLDDETFGPLAGEAFAGITGLDPADDRYWHDPPVDEDEDEAADEDAVDPDVAQALAAAETTTDDDADDDEPVASDEPDEAAAVAAADDAAFEADDLDADLTGDPAEDLRPPKPDEIRAWWQEHHKRFDPRHRYLAGRLAHGVGYFEALQVLSVRRRHALALEIAIRTRGLHHLPTRALSRLQRGALAAISTLSSLDGTRPYSRIS